MATADHPARQRARSRRARRGTPHRRRRPTRPRPVPRRRRRTDSRSVAQRRCAVVRHVDRARRPRTRTRGSARATHHRRDRGSPPLPAANGAHRGPASDDEGTRHRSRRPALRRGRSRGRGGASADPDAPVHVRHRHEGGAAGARRRDAVVGARWLRPRGIRRLATRRRVVARDHRFRRRAASPCRSGGVDARRCPRAAATRSRVCAPARDLLRQPGHPDRGGTHCGQRPVLPTSRSACNHRRGNGRTRRGEWLHRPGNAARLAAAVRGHVPRCRRRRPGIGRDPDRVDGGRGAGDCRSS